MKERVLFNKIVLAYFSGTGCTEMVVDCFAKRFIEAGIKVHKINIAKEKAPYVEDTDLLMLFSPVYACRLADIVEEWVKRLSDGKGTNAAIFSVSGAGEVTPNTACRERCKRLLKKKNYNVTYEKMFVMPSNYVGQAKEDINFSLINILPVKVESVIADLILNKSNVTIPKTWDWMFSAIGKMEHLGAKMFGTTIRASKECNQCGLCIKNCPKQNIKTVNKEIKFGFRCIWCMKCIYSCPRHALMPKFMKFVVLKNGFDIKDMADKAKHNNYSKDLRNDRDILWQGAIDYLKEE